MPLYTSLTDIDLVRLLKLGDQVAFTEIFNRYWDKLYLHALKMLEDEDDAKDLVQELFSSLWTRVAEFELQSSLSGYLYVMVRNKVLNHIRQQKTRNTFQEALTLYIDTHQHSVLEYISENELSLALEVEIQNLPPKMREIFELSRKQDLSHKEIASKLNISDKTVKKQINNALKIIRMKLDNTIGLIVVLSGLLK
ncbi:RNA polymerase sigma-70 factor, ECF subfamily [Pedobacter sp. ok626]|uniref:RNA polymerase sigma factor n=1 Tax=Pedobacter sp. ok626 TaxID=1761882 RepID=UPI0008801075|nr:RNA polymerase sigma-70 factor [Pedobacter sp. ok626]SDK18439.1 RNA polymerase sigma-70 factor, ECF subfamily [Pedobacter sp. ok626]